VKRRLLALVVALAAGCGGAGSGGQVRTCTQIGCVSAFIVQASAIPLDLAGIQASTLKVCRNGACLESSLASWDGRLPFIYRDPTQQAQLQVKVYDEPAGARFEITYAPGVDGALPDGDVYDVTLTAADGSTPIQLQHKSVTYQASQPNGPDCPPICYAAFVQL
jgi:hypothetical protein